MAHRLAFVLALTASPLALAQLQPVQVQVRPVATTSTPSTPGTVRVQIRPIAPTAKPATPAPAAAPAAVRLPFPPPLVGPVTADTKYTQGTVASSDPKTFQVHVTTAAGDLLCKLSQNTRIINSDGQPTDFTQLLIGGTVHVYYQVIKGAIVQELDMILIR